MQLSFSSILSHQSQLCNNTAQAMSCCPYHTGDKQLGPEATSTLPIPHSLRCMPRHPGKLPQGGLSTHDGNPSAKGISSVCGHRAVCASQTGIPLPCFQSSHLSYPESATFLLGQATRNFLMLRFLWICLLQSSRLIRKGSTAWQALSGGSDQTS